MYSKKTVFFFFIFVNKKRGKIVVRGKKKNITYWFTIGTRHLKVNNLQWVYLKGAQVNFNLLCDQFRPLSFITWFIQSVILSFRIIKTLSIPNRKSYGAEILRWFSLPPHTCHMSGVTCQVSGVRCQVSGVTLFFFFYKVVKRVGGGSVYFVINGAYLV